VLVNAIGVVADVGVEMAHLQLREGDQLLLCSDGLHDYFLVEQEIADMLGADPAGRGDRQDDRRRQGARRPRQHHRHRRSP
jgi:serine/threonine protein phosphatase PrpC